MLKLLSDNYETFVQSPVPKKMGAAKFLTPISMLKSEQPKKIPSNMSASFNCL